MFSFFKKAFNALAGFFGLRVVDEATLKQLKEMLLLADVGVETAERLMEPLHALMGKSGDELRVALSAQMERLVAQPPLVIPAGPVIYLMVGINGSGKTTTVAKLAHKLTREGKRVLMVAADTFRAAAAEQLTLWGDRMGVPVHQGTARQDPASVVYTAGQRLKNGEFDTLVIDTAGRLHTKDDLMRELAKVRSVIQKAAPDVRVITLLTVDSTLGQSSLEQAKLFHEATKLDGLVLTKTDGTGKGGIVFAITSLLKLPIVWGTYGEQLEDIEPFDAHKFITSLLAQS